MRDIYTLCVPYMNIETGNVADATPSESVAATDSSPFGETYFNSA